MTDKVQKKQNRNYEILSVVCVILLYLFLSLRYDFYFDLNDDLLIRDILSGRYTGTPEARTHQLLHPLGLVLSFCYRLFPKLPVFSLFLTICQGISLWMILHGVLRTTGQEEGLGRKGLLSLVLTLGMGVFLGREMVLVQYTAVSGMMCASACFWILTNREKAEEAAFLTGNLPALLLYLLAFGLRSEMGLLALPFLLLSLLFCCKGKKIRSQVFFFGILILCFGVLLFWDDQAYSKGEWKEFRQFFDARTRVYDYTWYPSYEEAEEFYKEQGISKVQYDLIRTYNFGLDEEITEETLEKIAGYNEKERHLGGLAARGKETVRQVLTQFFQKEELPYNMYVAAAYLLVVAAAVFRKNYLLPAGKMILVILIRSICWGYLFWSDRLVERVTHPLYLLEFVLLFGVFLQELKGQESQRKEREYGEEKMGHQSRLLGMAVLLFLILSLSMMKSVDQRLEKESSSRSEAVRIRNLLEEYTRNHSENYYYMDVYSMVNFTAKMYDNIDYGKRNYDYLGGWISKSPLEQKARGEALGLSIEEALLTDRFYLIGKESFDPAIIETYYREKCNLSVRLEQTDVIGGGEFYVYQVVQPKHHE